ncbi:MAG: hypothetical protein TREMPRED_000265 [Tremellales sp. Tagirdzhanova-0007]|nr:MAG: hypothetical protein TREMPRED_000265 [Tremellales sp. Tagirdzhanova-0007]
MTAIGRPGTPFPFPQHQIHHRSGSYTHSHQPIHFAFPALASPTPPSLLQRSTSSGSSSSIRSSDNMTPPSSSSVERRVSTNSNTSSSPSTIMPATPGQDTELPHAPPPSQDMVVSPFALPLPKYNWSDKMVTAQTIFDFDSSKTKPQRPPLVRRYTPRPTTTTLRSLATAAEEELDHKRRRLISIVDGGHWMTK